MIGEMLTGAGCATVGYLIGHVTGYLMGEKVRNVTSLLAADREPYVERDPDNCQCEHWRNAHIDGKGACSAAIGPDRVRCACKLFIGKPVKRPPNPLDLP